MSKARGGTSCPHCRAPAAVRTSRQITPLFREGTYACTNDMCGHVFVCGVEALRTLSPSALPDVEVTLPLSPHMRKTELAHQLRVALESSDE